MSRGAPRIRPDVCWCCLTLLRLTVPCHTSPLASGTTLTGRRQLETPTLATRRACNARRIASKKSSSERAERTREALASESCAFACACGLGLLLPAASQQCVAAHRADIGSEQSEIWRCGCERIRKPVTVWVPYNTRPTSATVVTWRVHGRRRGSYA